MLKNLDFKDTKVFTIQALKNHLQFPIFIYDTTKVHLCDTCPVNGQRSASSHHHLADLFPDLLQVLWIHWH